ncbi:hypothetical protein AVEN_67705-1 [Araneus ventricosus]|uniref:HTH psq-type domain-containing protein n=1 Tax=Araneus ventricosus TaxID=182803 RepID=A0A4Y2I658_ARAVE|nr:hypothetical protein AVEN_67705-1 [Araneus ventricosus]
MRSLLIGSHRHVTWLTSKWYHETKRYLLMLKVSFGESYSDCRQCRHADILSLSPLPLHSVAPFAANSIRLQDHLSPFCLSIGYFLSDSEALALPKCRTFIHAMEPTKRKRVKNRREQKFQIVRRNETGETLTKLSKEFGVGVSIVGDMRRDFEKIRKFYSASNGKSANLRKTMK